MRCWSVGVLGDLDAIVSQDLFDDGDLLFCVRRCCCISMLGSCNVGQEHGCVSIMFVSLSLLPISDAESELGGQVRRLGDCRLGMSLGAADPMPLSCTRGLRWMADRATDAEMMLCLACPTPRVGVGVHAHHLGMNAALHTVCDRALSQYGCGPSFALHISTHV